MFFFEGSGEHRDRHVLTHSFPTRRSSDLDLRRGAGRDLLRPADLAGALDAADRLRDDGGGPAGPSKGVSSRQAMRASRTMPRLLAWRSEEHTSELQSLMRISYAVFCLKTKKNAYKLTRLPYKNNTI